ncbi:hypothetical protein [Rhodococcus zopfii]|uniref:hypothetical protein n=1 Tax=Rhodococcus zopfii TaxID=43772 RepID=UPI000B033A17|nr:hypothetical protein [Rhodococcus zopfii]
MSTAALPRSAMSTLNIAGYGVACVASLVLIVASLGPWGVAQTPVNSLTFNGTDGTDGKITLIAGCVAGASLLLRAVWDSLWPFVVAMLAGVVCAVTGFVDLSRGQALFSDDQTFVSVGWGLWLLCIGSVALLLGVALCAITQAKNSDWTIGAELRELAGNPRELTFAIASVLCAIATIILVVWAVSIRPLWQ